MGELAQIVNHRSQPYPAPEEPLEIVGHRGACGHAPENTLKSFARAIELGCQRVEMDVHVSADLIPVVIHDPTVDRTTDGKGPVAAMTFPELKRLDAGDGERIPALTEVMHLCLGRVAIQIELKGRGSPVLVARQIEEPWDCHNVVITSFELPLLDEFSRIRPAIPMGLLNKNPTLDMIAVAVERRHQWICPRCDIVDQDLVARAHQAALGVYAYHVNDRQSAARLIDWRVDAIGTDHPEMVANLLLTKARATPEEETK
jgi:glycerophosphoryl diester phosphodiesterase